jgi:hypothetical protein
MTPPIENWMGAGLTAPPGEENRKSTNRFIVTGERAYLTARSPASPTDSMSRPSPFTVLQAAAPSSKLPATQANRSLRTKGLSNQCVGLIVYRVNR